VKMDLGSCIRRLTSDSQAAVTGPTCAEHSMPASDQSQFLATDFWSSLSTSISGVREILEDSSDEHEDASVGYTEKHDELGKIPSTDVNPLFPNVQSYHPESSVPPPVMSEMLFELFRVRVDTVYKVVHLPTILALIRAARSDGKQTANILALEHAMYFTAVCTIDDHETEAIGLGPRDNVLRSYRSAVERFLAYCHLLSYPDLHALQALVIYMVSNHYTWVGASRELTHARSGLGHVSTMRPRGH
jgi:hypothetical protein